MTLFTKVKWVLGIMVVFLLILMTNLVDRQNFAVVKDSIETIYADRLVAQDIIFNLYQSVLEKEVLYAKATALPPKNRLGTIDAQVTQSLELFATTKLTEREEVIFNQLKQAVADLRRLETTAAAQQSTAAAIPDQLTAVKEQLKALSAIQLSEGKQQLFKSQKAIGSAELFTQLEIGALIVLALAIQLILLYTPRVAEQEV
ncbi:chemotaxis protein [Neolewinella sp.]|uniref:chemotaxis protein n=1 Tax=Neolewinella sp. TaxID=2993543 RepID=UPI003B51AE88